jgi:hypothetical protein
MEALDVVELVERIASDCNLDLAENASRPVLDALEAAGTVYVPVADAVVAKSADKAINAAARGIAVAYTRTADLAAVPERNWTQEERTLRPRTEVS